MNLTEINKWLKTNKINLEAIKIKKIDKGLTNQIFKLRLSDNNDYKFRKAAQNKYINRKLETYIDSKINTSKIICVDKDYCCLSKWIDGRHPTKKDFNQAFFDQIKTLVNQIQAITLKQAEINFPIYFDNIPELTQAMEKEFSLYKEIVTAFNTNEFKLSHNDLSCGNLLIDKNKSLNVFDFEWSSYNHVLWDIGNLIKDLEVSYEQIIKIKEINNNLDQYLRIIFAVHFYTLFWTYRVPENEKILKYRNRIIKRTKYWFSKI